MAKPNSILAPKVYLHPRVSKLSGGGFIEQSPFKPVRSTASWTRLGKRIVDLVKIDIEGSEGDAITGMRNTIRRCGPVIIVEVLHSHRGRFVDSLNFLTGQGYTFYECTAEALMPLDNSVESLIVAESTNFLAVRNDSRFLSMLDPYIYRE